MEKDDYSNLLVVMVQVGFTREGHRQAGIKSRCAGMRLTSINDQNVPDIIDENSGDVYC